MRQYNTILIERPTPEIAIARLNRPDRLNAMTFEMFDEFITLQADVDTDSDIRVLVITGSGRGFCAGLDLDQAALLPDMTPIEMFAGQETWARSIAGFRHMEKPVIAAVNGFVACEGFLGGERDFEIAEFGDGAGCASGLAHEFAIEYGGFGLFIANGFPLEIGDFSDECLFGVVVGTVLGAEVVEHFVEGLAVFVGKAGGVGRDDEFESLGAFAMGDGVAGACFLACGRGGAF